jgi:hypothetical protein
MESITAAISAMDVHVTSCKLTGVATPNRVESNVLISTRGNGLLRVRRSHIARVLYISTPAVWRSPIWLVVVVVSGQEEYKVHFVSRISVSLFGVLCDYRAYDQI